MISTTEKQGLRSRLLEACIAKRLFMIDHLRERIKSIVNENGNGNKNKNANEETDNNTDADLNAIKINMLNHALTDAANDLKLFENLKMTHDFTHDVVSPGAIVVTNIKTFFVSANTDKVVIDARAYQCISVENPVFHAMNGKQKGETFMYRGTQYKIKEVM